MDCRELTRSDVSIHNLLGLWRRTLIAWPDRQRDESTKVLWLQGKSQFIDLRQPASLPNLSEIKCRDDLTRSACLALSQQEAFAGYLRTNDAAFEWVRMIDYQPTQALPDAGFLHWRNDILIETGRDQPYTEHWQRDTGLRAVAGLSFQLEERTTGCKAAFLSIGDVFMFARDRISHLPPNLTLHTLVCQASSDEHARQLVDCEISFGRAYKTDGPLIIQNSTLPWKVGTLFPLDLSDKATVTTSDIAPNGKAILRTWHRTYTEGNCQ